MLGRILRALFNFVCGSDSAQAQQKPPQQQYPPSKPPTVPQLPGHYPTPHQQYPPPRPEHKPTKPSKPYGKYEDDNKINQANEYYRDLRARANEEGDKMAQCFQQGHEAYARGDGALAKEFSNKGKAHQKNMEALNKQASDWIFEANNRDSGPGEIDLHGLYVKEAISRTEEALEAAKRRGDTELKLIVGKGLHSSNGAKIKPAIENLMKKYQLDAELDPNNGGVLVVRLNETRRRSRMGADEITRRIERGDEGCTIM